MEGKGKGKGREAEAAVGLMADYKNVNVDVIIREILLGGRQKARGDARGKKGLVDSGGCDWCDCS